MSDFYERISNLSQKRLMLLAMELQGRLEALESAPPAAPAQDRHAIAVIGMACRLPGGANTPEAYWQLLHEGRDAIAEIPADRWDINAYYDPNVEASGKMSTRWGGFMSHVDQFDPLLFGITPREAASMDPQQRIMLEVCWEALERAGCAPDRLAGSATGVFVGACNSDYAQLLMSAGLATADMYLATGGAHSVISGRVAYVLGLQGPAITFDTACSSALVAIYSAIQSLRSGDCRMALAGGVNAILTPDVSITLSKANMMAPDGRCKAFAAAADGFVRSEGCGMLVLKRLADAEADGDSILAVIRGAAINQDGRSNGLTAPNGPSQVAVIRAALADAGLSPAQIGYVETHGTGTSLGDPIEAQALGAALGPGHSAQNPLRIGSAKTNLGHLESAAGAAGLLKLILTLQHGEIPPHLHFHQPSPHIPWAELPISIPTTPTPWPAPRLGGVSSFGFSGTNVHLILENYAGQPAPTPAAPARPLSLLTFSAKTEKSLWRLAEEYQRLLENQPEAALAPLAYSANTGRARLPYRLAVVAANPAQAAQKLAALRAEAAPATPAARAPEVAFLYTGHGAQYVGMGQTLYETEPVFRRVMDQCNELARAYLPQPLLTAIDPAGDPALMQSMTYAQPAIFAIQVALTELWRAWGVQPGVVAGHSLGEYAAAVAAGIFSLEDGLKLVCARGRLMDHLPQAGGMAAVFASEAQIAAVLQPYAQHLAIAVINHPTNIVISGAQAALQAALADFEAQGIKTRRLAVAQAAHSPLLDPIRAEFLQVVAGVRFSEPRIDLISCTTGRAVGPSECSQPDYWWRHLRQPVQFVGLMQTLRQRNQAVYVEIGPHPVLISNAQRLLPTGEGLWLASLREKFDDSQQMLETLGALFRAGAEVQWANFYAAPLLPRVAVPTYPFDHQRYWFGSASTPARLSAGLPKPGGASILETRLNSPALESVVFEGRLSVAAPAYLDHHRIFGTAIAPSPAFLEMAVRAADELFGSGPQQVGNLAIQEALILPETEPKTFQIILTPTGERSAAFKIVSLEANHSWKTHATGAVAPAPAPASAPATPAEIAQIQTRCAEQISGADYYVGLAAYGLEFGESFRGLQHIWRRDGEALGKVQAPAILQDAGAGYRFHPAVLDACFHLLGAPLPGDKKETAYLLIGIDHFRLYRSPGGPLWNHTLLVNHTGETFTCDIRLLDESGALVAEALGVQLKRANRELLLRAVQPRFDDWFYTVQWQPQPLPLRQGQPAKNRPWCLLPGPAGFAEALQAQLSAAGQTCQLLAAGAAVPAGAHLLYLAGSGASLGADGPALLEEQTALCAEALRLAQHGVDTRLWIITRGAQPVDPATPPQPAQAALWGLGRVIALEAPETWGGLIDLDPQQPLAEQAAALIAEILAGTPEDQVAYRQTRRSVARLARTPRPPATAYSFAPNAAYLITGGLGGLGLVAARWLAQQGARHILLAGRQGLPPRALWAALPPNSPAAAQAAAIREIESATGAQLEALALDVSDADALARTLQAYPIRGILHAAADLSSHPLADLSAAHLRAMFRPKILGAWNLAQQTQAQQLDFLVLFSSTTALWGSSQLAHYAAANAFMDALAQAGAAQGRPLLSINWGTWSVMRAASAAEQQRTAQFGLEQMPAEAALGILKDLLPPALAQICVADVDWTPLKAAYEARRARPFLQAVASRRASSPAKPAAGAPGLKEQLKTLNPAERRAFIVEHVRRQVAQVINAPDPAQINPTQGLFEMGLDSLMSVELKNLLETGCGQPLPSTLTFNYPTIADLARYLDESVLAEPTAPPPPPAPTAPAETPPAPAAAEMSEDELEARLAARLAKLK